jgi:prolipoprotein diacylglyceryltransferase
LQIGLHLVFESLAYAVAFWLYSRERRRQGDILSEPHRNSIIVAAILGAAIGSKALYWLEDPGRISASPEFWLGGKTIVGALLGGTVAVEWIKRRLGISARTGDLFGIPLATGIAIGRIGCFLGGVEDHTYGIATALPWGVDFGDGVLRHPVQLYEIVFMGLVAWGLHWMKAAGHQQGDRFRVFLTSYLAWRVAVDFLKPAPAWMGLSAIPWAALAGLAWYTPDIVRLASRRSRVAHG